MTDYAAFFGKFVAKDLIANDFKLITCKASDHLPEVLKILVDNNVMSVPVLDDSRVIEAYLGFIDIIDIVTYIAVMTKAKELVDAIAKDPVDFDEYIKNEKSVLAGIKIGDMMADPDQQKRCPYITVKENDKLSNILDIFSKETNLRRVAIVNEDDKLVGLISQSRVIQFLFENIKDLEALGIETELVKNQESISSDISVLTISPNQTALDAFMKLVQGNVLGMALVDDTTGKLVGCMSVNDIKGSKYADLFHNLRKSVKDFLTDRKNRYSQLSTTPIAVTPEANLKAVLAQLALNHIHRVFVINSEDKPIQVISLCDVISCLHKK
eukprot:TRINITY_DN5887_c0_g1_i2.p1 TRINITY_DN5887_c0_g1~~TRINITY_DN5887_c0_g1_i2.p1  ORF type:complete len:359 (+),score=87.15 TRINITY_DN5887_c0_g1_i2:101-1078(+)